MIIDKARLMGVLSVALAMGLVGCSANPSPAPVEDPIPTYTDTSSQPEEPKTEQPRISEISVGIDPIRAGFNPHLLADDSVFVRTLASLVLPSAFVEGHLNEDLLVSADLLPEGELAPSVAQTVRYQIRPEAQWSDGSPITVADFQFLANAIVGNEGTLEAPNYRAIQAIRSSDAGKTVYVDFSQPLANWQSLFSNLLPAHLIRGERFDQALSATVPASAGIFSVGKIDRQLGEVALNRNDRFWGAHPANIEVLKFKEIRSASQGRRMLATGQIGFLDVTPTQTSTQGYELLGNVQVRQGLSDLRLELVAQYHLPPEVRRSLFTLIDVPAVARQAAEREVEVPLPAAGGEQADGADQAREEAAAALKEYGKIRIAVDSRDLYAYRAAETTSNILKQWGIATELKETDMSDLLANYVALGEVDLVVAWVRPDPLANLQCALEHDQAQQLDISTTPAPTPEDPATTQTTNPPRKPGAFVQGANISGYCSAEADAFIAEALEGKHSPEEVAAWSTRLNDEHHLSRVLLRDERIEALGQGIIGPDPALANFPEGLSSIKTWRNE